EGEALPPLLEKGRVGGPTSVEWMAVAAEAIAEVHAKGLVNRDFKPENLFITSQGVLKILDFGLASGLAPRDSEGRKSALNEGGAAVGSIGYMSPEQLRGQPSTAATDFFSL